jgi:hypothetical protein
MPDNRDVDRLPGPALTSGGGDPAIREFTAMRNRLAFLVCTLLLGVAVAFPLGVLASHQFSDVATNSIFHSDIDAIAAVDVTSGCGGGKYCPKDYVTREQMAAFMNRLGALSPSKTPVVNADKVDGFSSGDLGRVAFAYNPALINGAAAPTTGTLTAAIIIPARGYVAVSGNTTLYNPASSGAGDSSCVLRFQGGNTLPGSYHQTSTGSPGGTNIWVNQCTSQSVVQVCEETTYFIEFYVQAGTADTSAQNATLIVQYTPFGNTGLQPACTSS